VEFVLRAVCRDASCEMGCSCSCDIAQPEDVIPFKAKGNVQILAPWGEVVDLQALGFRVIDRDEGDPQGGGDLLVEAPWGEVIALNALGFGPVLMDGKKEVDVQAQQPQEEEDKVEQPTDDALCQSPPMANAAEPEVEPTQEGLAENDKDASVEVDSPAVDATLSAKDLGDAAANEDVSTEKQQSDVDAGKGKEDSTETDTAAVTQDHTPEAEVEAVKVNEDSKDGVAVTGDPAQKEVDVDVVQVQGDLQEKDGADVTRDPAQKKVDVDVVKVQEDLKEKDGGAVTQDHAQKVDVDVVKGHEDLKETDWAAGVTQHHAKKDFADHELSQAKALMSSGFTAEQSMNRMLARQLITAAVSKVVLSPALDGPLSVACPSTHGLVKRMLLSAYESAAKRVMEREAKQTSC